MTLSNKRITAYQSQEMEASPHMVNLDMFATVIFILRVWSPDKSTIVVLEVKYDLACCAYSESVAQ